MAGLRRKSCSKHKEDFLEIGVLVTNPATLDTVNIFVPFPAARDKISDLGPRFDKTDIAQGIFNEKLSCGRANASSSWIDLRRQSEDLFCRVHVFSENEQTIDQAELSTSSESGGTRITISRRAIDRSSRGLNEGERLYFRLRVMTGTKKGGPFVRVITPLDHAFQSGFEEVEYIDFRLNESRTLPSGIERRIKDDSAREFVPISLVAFLTAVPVLAELSVSHTEFHKNRLLEESPWNDYAPQPLPPGMMVYHWKKEAEKPIEDFAAFVKLQTRRTGRRVIFVYLAIAFAFGIAGNLAASWLQAYVPWFDPAAKKPVPEARQMANDENANSPSTTFMQMPPPQFLPRGGTEK
ncbi:hypothetical protein J2X36_005100 [Methylobacterium sp. BE186]|uniref:hypothetical protein n=1 Tax=Methylobacterium sp. BE186 TaxID=2817715 RepID=UPI0028673586|nr:hypothetical protein [Methylobacterium sp. BE186]MDR7040318.1 hypothetical protein [Methylobacterium sp. BE186]